TPDRPVSSNRPPPPATPRGQRRGDPIKIDPRTDARGHAGPPTPVSSDAMTSRPPPGSSGSRPARVPSRSRRGRRSWPEDPWKRDGAPRILERRPPRRRRRRPTDNTTDPPRSQRHGPDRAKDLPAGRGDDRGLGDAG